MPIEFFQITAAYSNAVLVAIMPHVSDFARTLDLPTPQPVTQAQIRRFYCFPRSDHVGGRVVLKNGCEFTFDHGRVETFESPRSYFNEQDPNKVPTYFAPVKISETGALQIAHDAIKHLGYTDAMLAADRTPEITVPKRSGTNYIARYRLRWYDPARGSNPRNPPTSVEFEIDATTGQICYLYINNPNTYGPNLKLDVAPTVINDGPQETHIGPGRKVTAVTPEYARGFLAAALPQLSEFLRKIGLGGKIPVSEADVNMTRYLQKYNCGIVEGDLRAFIDMKSGGQFIYSHGQVVGYYSPDAMNHPDRKMSMTYPEIDLERKRFFGAIKMPSNEVVAFVRQSIKNLGYTESQLHIEGKPMVEPPAWWGTNRIARSSVIWYTPDDGKHYPDMLVSAEVDVANQALKFLYINDHANTNIWRKPPKLKVPLVLLPSQDEPTVSPQPDTVIKQENPAISLPERK